MNIRIKNFGPIHDFQFDSNKDIQLLFGKNAIGKSYAVYCIYCILKNLRSVYRGRNPFVPVNMVEPFIEKVIDTIKKSKDSKIDISYIEQQYYLAYLNKFVADRIASSFSNTFSSLENLDNKYTNVPYEITIETNNSFKVKISANKSSLPEFNSLECIPRMEFRKKNTKGTKFSIYKDTKMWGGASNLSNFKEIVSDYLQHHLAELLSELEDNTGDIYFLPASRSGLYQALSSFSPILAELTQNRFFLQSKNIELPSLSEPLSDYFIDISTLSEDNINENSAELVEKIESKILNGRVSFDHTSKKIMYSPNGLKIDLELSEASSMVAELSPIVLYLKHIINHKFRANNPSYLNFMWAIGNNKKKDSKSDIIFIEEPEAHLHPEVQVQLMEIFAHLDSIGVKLIMTTHSNYMFNKLNNMIIGKTVNSEEVKVYHLTKTNNGSVLNEDMSASVDGIDDNNFSDVSKVLFEERMKIYEDSNDD